jgi:hypothetical protein
MKHFTSIEIGGMVLAAFLFLSGLTCVIWPRAIVVVHFTNDGVTGWPGSSVESVSTTGARVYGVLGMLLGCGIATLAIYRRKT